MKYIKSKIVKPFDFLHKNRKIACFLTLKSQNRVIIVQRSENHTIPYAEITKSRDILYKNRKITRFFYILFTQKSRNHAIYFTKILISGYIFLKLLLALKLKKHAIFCTKIEGSLDFCI